MKFDEELSRRIDALYATPDVAATRIAVLRAVGARIGETALDIGCGPGYLTKELALSVGPSGSVVGLDISEAMLSLARVRCHALDQVRLVEASTDRLPADDSSIDIICALQVLAYVSNLEKALAEIKRVLKPAGRVVILDTDFEGLVWESRDRARMQRVLAAYDDHCAWPDLPRILPRALAKAGLSLNRCEAVPLLTTSYHSNTYVHGLARIIHGFAIEPERIPRVEADAWLAEFDDLEADRAFFFGVSRYVFLAGHS